MSRLNQGVALLESLAALAILAFAVLGMLAVQARTLADAQTGVRRGQAVRLIEDLGERIKSNPDGRAQLASYAAGWDTAPAAADCRQRPCHPADQAQWDLADWKRNVADALPLGKAYLFASADGHRLGVIVGWRSHERAGDASLGAALRADLDQTGIACPDGLICHLAYVEP
jgi:type IV pilus assembly protein PilV